MPKSILDNTSTKCITPYDALLPYYTVPSYYLLLLHYALLPYYAYFYTIQHLHSKSYPIICLISILPRTFILSLASTLYLTSILCLTPSMPHPHTLPCFHIMPYLYSKCHLHISSLVHSSSYFHNMSPLKTTPQVNAMPCLNNFHLHVLSYLNIIPYHTPSVRIPTNLQPRLHLKRTDVFTRTSILCIPLSSNASASLTYGGGTGPNVFSSTDCCALSTPRGSKGEGLTKPYSAEESIVRLFTRQGKTCSLNFEAFFCFCFCLNGTGKISGS